MFEEERAASQDTVLFRSVSAVGVLLAVNPTECECSLETSNAGAERPNA